MSAKQKRRDVYYTGQEKHITIVSKSVTICVFVLKPFVFLL